MFSGYGRRDAVEHLLAVGANVHARDDGGLVNMASIFIDDIKLEYFQLLDHKSFFILYLFCSLLYHRIFPQIYYVDKKSFAVVNFISQKYLAELSIDLSNQTFQLSVEYKMNTFHTLLPSKIASNFLKTKYI